MFKCNVARAAGAALCLLVASEAIATSCVNFGTDLVVDGNKSVDICLKTTTGGEPRTFSYQLFGAGSTWRFDAGAPVSSPTSASGTLTATNGVNGTEQHYTLITTGVPITGTTPSSTHYGRFLFCYKPFLNVTCMDSAQFTQTVRLRVDPIVRLSTTDPITTNTITQVSATLGAAGDNPTVGAAVQASCTQANGAGVLWTPNSLTTGGTGSTSNFTITTSNLVVYAPSGAAPSGLCTFKTAVGTGSATIAVQGQRLSPTLSVSPSAVDLPAGDRTLSNQEFTFSTTPPAANAPITVSCSGPASPSSANLTTNSQGKATFTTTASSMVSIHPAARPMVSCSFTLGTLSPVTATIRGVQLSPALTLSPVSISGTGTTPITTTLITALGTTNAFPGFRVNANCTSTRPDVILSVSPANLNTNPQGQATFDVQSPVLGFADPSTSVPPPAKCTFTLDTTSTVQTITLPYTNACSAGSPYLPLPAECGNP